MDGGYPLAGIIADDAAQLGTATERSRGAFSLRSARRGQFFRGARMAGWRSARPAEDRGAIWQAAIFSSAVGAVAGIERATREAAVVWGLLAGKPEELTRQTAERREVDFDGAFSVSPSRKIEVRASWGAACCAPTKDCSQATSPRLAPSAWTWL